MVNKASHREELAPVQVKWINEDLEQSFLSLSKNMALYAQLTEILQQPTSRTLWIERFKHRAEKVHDLRRHNELIIKHIVATAMTNYAQDIEEYNDDLRYTDLAELGKHNVTFFYFNYLAMMVYNKRLIFKEAPFFVEILCDRYMPDIKARMPHSEIALLYWTYLMDAQFYLTMLGDKKAPKKMIQAAQEVLKFKDRYGNFSSDIVRIRFLHVFNCLLYVENITDGNTSANMAIDTWEFYQQLQSSFPDHLGISDPSLMEELQSIVNRIECFIPFYSIYYHNLHPEDAIHDDWIGPKLRQWLDSYPADDPNPYTYHAYAYAKRVVGDWTANQAYDMARNYYMAQVEKPDTRYGIPPLSSSMFIVRSLLYMLYETDYPIEVKQVRTAYAMDLILEETKRCPNHVFSFELTNAIGKCICDPKPNAYLDTAQRRANIHNMLRGELIPIYAHGRMVSRISECLLDAIIHYKPELLIGTMGIRKAEHVKNHTRQLSEFLSRAAMIHDLGKVTMLQIVRNDFLPSTPHELELLEKHSQSGLPFLHIDPSFKRYHDVMLYHQKWYDGSQGFPHGDKNTRSPYRLFTDIINIAGQLEVGTDSVGHPGKQSKHFSETFDELCSLAGTRYNPDVLQLISKHSSVYRSLSTLIHHGWEYNYYEIYLDYFGKR